MDVVVSVGGSVLSPAEGGAQLRRYAAAIDRLLAAGCRVGVVVGGGATAVDYIETGRELGANEIALDAIGIAVTRLNARLLIAAFEETPLSAPAETYEAAKDQLVRAGVAIMGGTSPGHTTDAVSAALAEYLEADLLVFATSVPGVYDADPNTDPDATKFDTLTPDELVELIAALEMNAGSPAPVDLLGAKLIERAGLQAVVVDGTEPDRVVAAIQEGEHEGTEIRPEGATDPPA